MATQRRGLGRRLSGRDNVSDQALAARGVVARYHCRLRHRRVLFQSGLDLTGLDTEAADLHLIVDPAQELQRAIGQPARRSPVRYSRDPGSALIGSATNRSAVSPSLLRYPRAQTRAADKQLTRYAHR